MGLVAFLNVCEVVWGQQTLNTDLTTLKYGNSLSLISKVNGAAGYWINPPDCFHPQAWASYNSTACETAAWSLDFYINNLSKQLDNPEYLAYAEESLDYCDEIINKSFGNEEVCDNYFKNWDKPFPTANQYSEFCTAVQSLSEELNDLKRYAWSYVTQVVAVVAPNDGDDLNMPTSDPISNNSNGYEIDLIDYDWDQYESWNRVGVDVGERTSSATRMAYVGNLLSEYLTDESLSLCIDNTRKSMSSLRDEIDKSLERFIKCKNEGTLADAEVGSSYDPYIDFLSRCQKYFEDVNSLIEGFNASVKHLDYMYTDRSVLWNKYMNELEVYRKYYSLYPSELPKYVDYLKSLRAQLPMIDDLKGLLQQYDNKLQLPEYVESSDGQRYPVEGIAMGLLYSFEYDEPVDVVIPSNINLLGSLEENSFYMAFGYPKINSISCSSIIPPMARTIAFSSAVYDNAVLIVPDESLELYKDGKRVLNAWHLFKNIIPMSEAGVDSNLVDEELLILKDGILSNPGNEEVSIYNMSGIKIYSGKESMINVPKGQALIVRTSTRSAIMIN